MKLFTIAPDVKLGKNANVYNFVNLYSLEMQAEKKIELFVENWRSRSAHGGKL
jgi:hypothetical protein